MMRRDVACLHQNSDGATRAPDHPCDHRVLYLDRDEDWPEILKALSEVGYSGWATAEVDGGGEKELRDVYERMAKCLGRP